MKALCSGIFNNTLFDIVKLTSLLDMHFLFHYCNSVLIIYRKNGGRGLERSDAFGSLSFSHLTWCTLSIGFVYHCLVFHLILS